MVVCEISNEPVVWDASTGRWSEEYSGQTHTGPCRPVGMVRVLMAQPGMEPCDLSHVLLCHSWARYRVVNAPAETPDLYACEQHLGRTVDRSMLTASTRELSP